MKMKIWMLAAAVVVILAGGIVASSALGFWNTTGRSGNGNGGGAALTDPQSIRGSTTFGQIADVFGIPLEDLGAAFAAGKSADYEEFRCRDLETLYTDVPEGTEIGVGSVRYFVSMYIGFPCTAEEEAWLPGSAAEILLDEAGLTPEESEEVLSRTVEIP